MCLSCEDCITWNNSLNWCCHRKGSVLSKAHQAVQLVFFSPAMCRRPKQWRENRNGLVLWCWFYIIIHLFNPYFWTTCWSEMYVMVVHTTVSARWCITYLSSRNKSSRLELCCLTEKVKQWACLYRLEKKHVHLEMKHYHHQAPLSQELHRNLHLMYSPRALAHLVVVSLYPSLICVHKDSE